MSLGLLAGGALTSACTPEETGPTGHRPSTGGALVRMNMSARVAVLLDDVPAGPLREAAACAPSPLMGADALAQSRSFWIERAARQVRLTYYRPVFRSAYYSSSGSSGPHMRGPLPPRDVWNIALAGPPHRVTTPKHDQYAPGSVFDENTWYFYDDSCKAGMQACHITVTPQESCVEALQKHTGALQTAVHFTHVPYDAAIARAYRTGTIVNPAGADLSVIQAGMQDEHRFVYRYFEPGSGELDEGVIGKLGRRRLQMFSAIVQNNGTAPIHIGDVFDNNVDSIAVSSPGGSYVTEAIKLGQIGKNWDCGFIAQDTLRTCRPGQAVTLTCTNQGPESKGPGGTSRSHGVCQAAARDPRVKGAA
jgi:hypothetical protein